MLSERLDRWKSSWKMLQNVKLKLSKTCLKCLQKCFGTTIISNMKSTNDLVHELMERDDQASDMEDLIAEIKSTLESPFYPDEFKLKNIQKTLDDYGF